MYFMYLRSNYRQVPCWFLKIGVNKHKQFTALEMRRRLGRVNFRKDLWDCYCGQGKKLTNS